MFVIDDLKLKKFSVVSVPRPRDLYARIGGRVPKTGATGFKANFGQNKFDILASDVGELSDYQAELGKGKMPLAETLH